MTLCRLVRRASLNAGAIVCSLCVLAGATGAVMAQSSDAPAKPVFRDARLLSILDDEQPAPAAKQTTGQVVAAQFEKPGKENESAKIKPVGATVKKPAPTQQKRAKDVALTQYAEAQTAPATAQNLLSDEPYVDACPDPRDMPSILDVPYKLIPSPGKLPESCPLPDEDFVRKAPTPITFTWKASNLCYKPLYFEDVQLERYGHYRSPLLQPALSRVRFLLTIPCLPYLMGVNPPNECIYDLGYYRPGNCAPSMVEPIPISLRGALLEAGAVVGAAAAIP